jgi:hypothetical protein
MIKVQVDVHFYAEQRPNERIEVIQQGVEMDSDTIEMINHFLRDGHVQGIQVTLER